MKHNPTLTLGSGGLPFCFLILLTGSLATSCSTEVELEGPWKDIPVVYGFLALQDTAHYIRVEKAFLPADGDAREVAQLPDSLYYDKASVQLEKIETGELFDLRRVDGNREGYPRDEGLFARSPNYLYKIRAAAIQLEGGEPVRLRINRGESLPLVTAETRVLSELIPRSTSPGSPINMAYDRQINFAWSAGPEAEIFDVRLQIHYLESKPGAPAELEPQVVEWVLDEQLRRSDDAERVSISIPGEDFYIFLSENIPLRSGVIRVFDRIDLVIAGAGEELVELLRVNSANLGLSSFQSVPEYSNLSEGRGIFSSRAFAVRPGMTLRNESLDSLRDGIHTAALNFR